MAAKSKLDAIYRRLLVNSFFEKGWGKPENLRKLFEFRKVVSTRELCYPLIPADYPLSFVKKESYSDCTMLEGNFMTPLELYMPGVVPKAAQQAHFQIILPKKWNSDKHKPMCIHLAGTGDHFFWRRRNFMAKPLLKEGNIGSIILENPFYGMRKPDDQVRSNLHNVSDIFVMGGCLIMECMVLLHWCERNGFGPLGLTGLSMGGHMASLAACNWPRPLVLVPCLSWSTASTVFTTGVLSQSINWDILETQYYSDGNYRERLSKMVTVVDDAFQAGKNFIKDFNQSINELRKDIKDARSVMQTAQTESVGDKTQPDNDSNPKINEFLAVMPKAQETVIQKSPSKEWALTKLMKSILPGHVTASSQSSESSSPKPKSVSGNSDKSQNSPAPIKPEKFDVSKTNWWEREALQFMRGMMDECTHLKNFTVPYDTSLIIAVCAKEDAYIPREGITSLEEVWPGAEVRYLDAGHVSAYVLNQKFFRSCIIEAFERAKKIYEEDDIRRKGEALTAAITYDQLIRKYASSV